MSLKFELHFSQSKDGEPKLVRTEFTYDEIDENTLPSKMWATHQGRDDPKDQFQWREGVKGLAVLFLRSRASWPDDWTERPGLSEEQNGELGSALYHQAKLDDSAKRASWLRRMFRRMRREGGLKDPKIATSFEHHLLFDFDSADKKVWLAKDKWKPEAIHVFLNEQPLTSPPGDFTHVEEMLSMAERIEGKVPRLPIDASVDLLVRDARTGRFCSARENPDVLPVKKGDRLQIRAKLNQPAWVCLIWVDQHGKLFAMHQEGEISNFAPLGPTMELDVPSKLEGLSVDGPQGLETIGLLVSHNASDVSFLKKLRPAVPKLNIAQINRPIVSLYGRDYLAAKSKVSTRGPVFSKREDPVRTLHEHLAERLSPYFDRLVFLSFVNAGETTNAPNEP